VFPLYRITRDLFGYRPAFWASLTFALLPDTLLCSTLVIRDPPFFLLFLWAVYFAQKTIATRRVVHLLAAASCVGASALFRAEGLIFLPVFLLVLAVLAVLRCAERRDYMRLLCVWVALPASLVVFLLVVSKSPESITSLAAAWAASFDDYLRIDFLGNYRRIAAELQRMDDATLHSIVGQHFAGTARRFIPVIFLLGILQMAVKVILPINLVPLIWGLRKSPWDLRQALVFGTAMVFWGVLYVFFVWYDFILSRYFYLPAVMLCPWVGAGIALILERVRSLRSGKLWVAAVVGVLVVVPALGFDKHFKKKDDLAVQAGAWIAGQDGFKGMKMVFSDPVVAFYTGRVIRFDGVGDTIWFPDIDDQTFSRIERFALGKNADLIVLYFRSDRKNTLHPFRHYKVLREFAGGGRHVIVYGPVDIVDKAGFPSPGS
ncbi:MAG: glycosyltransferase family 39 protein, partial [Desulfobacterales bacterium]|nr:glycosyltransferase family 39 protein [Desulfobacterales bacterium]